MTLDTALLYRPTESLISPKHRRFFPFRIPNTHRQLRHYISTADADRIYVAVGRIIYSIRISSRKREIITIVPFDPKCLAAGYGWIGVGGSDSGDCAFIKLEPQSLHPTAADTSADVDSPLPELNIPSSRTALQCPPEVIVQEFGGSIVNSVTIHRLPADGDRFAHEDVALLSNNDMTVSIFSLTRLEIIETILHPIPMNFAIISPDSRLLAAVGDENKVYFYRVISCPEDHVSAPNGDKLLRGWHWQLIRSAELDDVPRNEDKCCFTVAFSPSSQLCAVGSQAGVITVFDVGGTLKSDDTGDKDGREDILCVFRSSRSGESGAVRCMEFAPYPWDLLVWVEDHGRVGVADVRQSFSRCQILTLDLDASDVERVKTENLDKIDDNDGSDYSGPEDAATDEPIPPLIRGETSHDSTDSRRGSSRRISTGVENQSMRESLARDLTARERQIIDFLNTARWASSIEEGSQRIPRLLSPLPYSTSPAAQQQVNHSPGSSSPPDRSHPRHEPSRDQNSDRNNRVGQPRRRNSVVLSQDNPSSSRSFTQPSSVLINHPTISLRWTHSPPQLSQSILDHTGSNNEGPNRTSSNNETPQPSSSSSNLRAANRAHQRSRALLDNSLANNNASGSQRQRTPRSRSIPRRSDRPGVGSGRAEPPVPTNPDLRSSLASERLRVQRQMALEDSQRMNEWEQQYRRLLEYDYVRPSPRARNFPSDLSDRHIYGSNEAEMGVGTAGIGWAEDGQTFYIGTVRGILEYHINVQDRKTFPLFSCR